MAIGRLYGRWLRAEEAGSMEFLNAPEDNGAHEKYEEARDKAEIQICQLGCDRAIEKARTKNVEKTRVIQEDNTKSQPSRDLQTAREISPELDALILTMEKTIPTQVLGVIPLILNFVRQVDFDRKKIGDWAKEWLGKLSLYHEEEREVIRERDDILLWALGLDKPRMAQAYGEGEGCSKAKENYGPILTKRAMASLDCGPRKRMNKLFLEELKEVNTENATANSEGSPRNRQDQGRGSPCGEYSTPRPRCGRTGTGDNRDGESHTNISSRRWKREARNRRLTQVWSPEPNVEQDFQEAEEAGHIMPLPHHR